MKVALNLCNQLLRFTCLPSEPLLVTPPDRARKSAMERAAVQPSPPINDTPDTDSDSSKLADSVHMNDEPPPAQRTPAHRRSCGSIPANEESMCRIDRISYSKTIINNHSFTSKNNKYMACTKYTKYRLFRIFLYKHYALVSNLIPR